MSSILHTIQHWWHAEANRHFLWLPVLFAAGIAAYFSLNFEPDLSYLWAIAGFAGGLLVLTLVTFKPLRPAAIAVLLIALGALAAGLNTARQSQVLIHESLTPRPTRGAVEEIERTEHGVRLTLGDVRIEGLAPEATPTRVRLTVRPKKGTEIEYPHIGDRIWILAGVLPPMGPALPHGFDFARYFFFRDIGAVGFGLPPWYVDDTPPEKTLFERFMDWRFRLTDRIIDAVGGSNGPIAAGLITGEARAISEEDFDALKASNLYHIIAISGGHMVVIAGVIYIGLRLLFLLLPGGFSSKPSGKSTAAFITLILTSLYLAVTGAPISAVRAYVMIVLVLMAVILQRRVDPMRSLSLTFLFMLILDPSDLFEPGFQLSFAATLAIVALVEESWLKHQGPPREDLWYRVRHLFVFSLMISVVAELATMPLSIAMFNNFSAYGILANVVATPLVSLFLMPVVALFFLLLPLGLESIALTLLDYGITALLWIARSVASFPGAQMFLPSLPGWGVALFALGLCWFCLWQHRPRYLGVPMMVMGFLSLFTVALPDILMGPDAKQIAFRSEQGYMQAKGKSGSMIAELWAHGVGQDVLLKRDKTLVDCDDTGCLAEIGTVDLAFAMRKKFNLAAMCQRADIVILGEQQRCPGRGVWELAEKAPLRAIWLEHPRRMETSADWQGNRPWRAKPFQEADE